jgi:hypothetical protein
MTTEQQDWCGITGSPGEARWVNCSKLQGAVKDGKHERTTEGGHQVTKVASSKLFLAFCTQANNARVLGQNADRQHVMEDRVPYIGRHARRGVA